MANGYIKELFKYLKCYKQSIVKCIILTIAINVISVLTLYQFKMIIDQYIPNKNSANIYIIALTLFVMIIVNFIFQRIYLKYLNKLTVGSQYQIRQDVFTHIQKAKYEFSSKRKFSEVNTNIIQDVDSLGDAIFQRLVNSFAQVLYFISTFFVLFYVNTLLALSVFCFMVIFSIVIIKLKNIMEKCSEDFACARSDLYNTVSDLVDGIKIISINNVEDNFISRVEYSNKDCNHKWVKTNIFLPGIYSCIEIATLITYLLTFIIGSKLMVNGYITLGGLMLYLSYLPEIWNKYFAVVDIFSGMLNAKIFAKRVLSSFETESHEEYYISKYSENMSSCNAPSIVIQEITFAYNNHSENVYSGFSCEFNTPGIYCIVGESGCGKSTLLELLLRFYEVNQGVIYINHLNINEYSLKKLRCIIGMVHQEPFIIKDTVIGNIRFGDYSISDKKIIDLIESLGFDKYLGCLEKGYYTELACRSTNITKGQKRLISILRVLVREPEILLLDEITANVDSFTERLIHKFLKEISKRKICLFVTHKLDDILLADKVIDI